MKNLQRKIREWLSKPIKLRGKRSAKRPKLQGPSSTEEEELYLPSILNEETQLINYSNNTDNEEEPRKDDKLGSDTKNKRTSTMVPEYHARINFSTSPISK